MSWSTRIQPAQKSAGKGRAQRQQEEKKEGKGGMLVPSNAWAALASDSEDEDSDSGSDSDASDAQSEQEEEEEGTEPDAASEPASAPVVAIGRSDDPKIQQLLDLGASREQAVDSLEQAGGDGTIDFVFARSFPWLAHVLTGRVAHSGSGGGDILRIVRGAHGAARLDLATT